MSVLVEDLPSELFKEHRVAFTKQHIIGFRMLQSAPVTSLEFIGRCRACQGRLICESLSRKRAWKSEVVRREMSHDVTMSYQFLAVSHDLKFNLFNDRISFAVQ